MWYTNVEFSKMCDMYFMYTVESKSKYTEIFKDVKNGESVAKVMRVLQRCGECCKYVKHIAKAC